ncbi:helix-turn-helix domain-containing protein [Streptomyces sp. NPDC056291]|uniref:helix-turn-helix domain-containing protein n=1 Tax=Streptomyces sp. NPDC056291 TaxID=3345772 RepID=UPI0035D7A94C
MARQTGSRRAPVDDQEIVRRYNAGESELTLSRAFGVSRTVIRRRLTESGVALRTVGEANRLRMQRLTFEERAALASAANEARRNDGWGTVFDPSGEGELRSLSIARTREVTKSAAYAVEDRVIEALTARGLTVRTQVAVKTYNLDIAVGNVAVEVHSAAYHPGRHPRLVRRTVELGEAGWSVLYVWITRAHPYVDRCADELVTHLNALQGLPPDLREERVVRGSGQLAAILRVDLDQRTLVPAAVDVPHF